MPRILSDQPAKLTNFHSQNTSTISNQPNLSAAAPDRDKPGCAALEQDAEVE
jgi:hypothetical protein